MRAAISRPTVATLVATLVAASAGAAPAAAQGCPSDAGGYTLAPLTGLEGLSFSAVALNDAGQVAGRILPNGTGDQEAFVWQSGQLVTRAFPGATVSVTGLSESGVVTGTVYTPGPSAVIQTFVWDSAADVLSFPKTPPGSFPAGISDAPLVVGSDEDNLYGYAHDLATGVTEVIAFGQVPQVGVGTPGAEAANDAGVVVGGEVVFDQGQGFYVGLPWRWTAAGGIEQLAVVPGGFGGCAAAVSPGGAICGTVIDEFFAHHAAWWTDDGATLTNLGSPFGYFVSDALAVNDHGQVTVVAPNDFFGFTRGFVWQGGTYTDLSCFTPSGLFVTRPVDINDAGQILVHLTDAGGLSIVGSGIMEPDQPPVPALEVQRLGTPPNPAAFLPGQTSGPLLGASWDPVIDHTTFAPLATQDFAFVALTPANLPLPGLGTALCLPSSVLQTFAAAPASPFAIAVPNNAALLGLTLCTQGASLDPAGIHLTNALDVTLGNY